MRTVEIPREAWVQQLDEFTAIHDGWLVSLDVLGPEIGAQPEIANLPLLGVSADRVDHDRTITVSVARSATEHFTHIIHAATRVYVERTDDGADAALEIESVDGTKTILRFRVAALPETVDGLVRQGARTTGWSSTRTTRAAMHRGDIGPGPVEGTAHRARAGT